MHMSREAHGAREPLTATSPSWTPSRLKVPRRTTQKKTKNNPRTCMARSVRYSSDKEFGLEVQICRFGGLERKQVTFYSALQLFTCRERDMHDARRRRSGRSTPLSSQLAGFDDVIVTSPDLAVHTQANAYLSADTTVGNESILHHLFYAGQNQISRWEPLPRTPENDYF